MWNFAKRHKKKLIFSAVVAGGAYAVWRSLQPKLEELQELQKLLSKLAEASSAGGAEGADGANSAEEKERKQRQRFENKQQTSDVHARKYLPVLEQRQNETFLVEACSAALREAQDREAKLEAFKALQGECLAKVASALYTVHLALLMHRVGFNIVGREVQVAVDKGEEQPDEAGSAYVEFLTALEHFSAAGFAGIAQALRAATLKVVASMEFTPRTQVTAELLQTFFSDVCREADTAILAQAKAPAMLLPDGLEANVSEANRQEVKRLLDEARDYLESPQFLQVFQTRTADATGVLVKGLVADAAGEGPWPLGKFFGSITKSAGLVVAAEDETSDLSGASCVRRFAEAPEVLQLCEGLYGLHAVEVA